MPAIPDDVRAFWLIARSASLFKDQQYGQWGIEILDPQGAIEETNRQILSRPQDFHAQDLVLATFLGDSDLLVISCEAGRAEFGSVLVARPLDPRQDWPLVAVSFADFLERVVGAEGDKYWELQY